MSGELFVLAITAGVVLFLLRRAWRRGPARASFPGAFQPHLAVQLTARGNAFAFHQAVFAIGRDGFTVRSGAPLPLQPGVPQRVEVEFLKPELARQRFVPGAAFSVVDGPRLVADGEVLGQNEVHEPGQG